MWGGKSKRDASIRSSNSGVSNTYGINRKGATVYDWCHEIERVLRGVSGSDYKVRSASARPSGSRIVVDVEIQNTSFMGTSIYMPDVKRDISYAINRLEVPYDVSFDIDEY